MSEQDDLTENEGTRDMAKGGKSGGGDLGFMVGIIAVVFVLVANPTFAASLLDRVLGGAADAITAPANPRPKTNPNNDNPTSTPATGPRAGDPTARTLTTTVEHRTTLDRLVEKPAQRRTDYRRAEFGDGWADTDGNGCRKRVDVLAGTVDRNLPFTNTPTRTCADDITAGTWVDAYTGDPLTATNIKDQTQAQAIQIDHRVALATAWRDGAWEWTRDERIAFYHDPINLAVTSGPTNAAKADIDASGWRPKKPYQCDFAKGIIKTKAVYALPVHPTEKKALNEMLDTCTT